MNKVVAGKSIEMGQAFLGIEFGSTRIKGVLINKEGHVLASGAYGWENKLVDDIWTYDLDEVWIGLQSCYVEVAKKVEETYDVKLSRLAGLGISGMMHGYLVFNEKGDLLTPFRTWRNNRTSAAASELSAAFTYPIPQRWSIAHLYQSILDQEEHVKDIKYMTTLAGYVHWKLTGRKCIGIGEGSGMFPVDISKGSYSTRCLKVFDGLLMNRPMPWSIGDILPEVLLAGEEAGVLSIEGAALLDPTGHLSHNIPLCPPEGDADTGMVATNSLKERTGNVSAGTSVFAMIVLEEPLKNAYSEIDLLATPEGKQVAMVHSNNCSSDIDAWVSLFGDVLKTFGQKQGMDQLYTTLFNQALQGQKDGGGLLAYNYFSGEHMTGFSEGRPLLVRQPDSRFNVADVMRTHLMTALGALRLGMDLLVEKERVALDQLYGHGGYFKTEGVGQSIMAAAMNAPVAVMETASEGGAWGIALLALYSQVATDSISLSDLLEDVIFKDFESKIVEPTKEDVEGFNTFMKKYVAGLEIEKAAVENLI